MRQTDRPLLRRLYCAKALMRTTAMIVVVAFSLSILTPTVVAAQSDLERQRRANALVPTEESAFADTLHRLERRLTRFEARLAKRLDSAQDEQDLRRLKRQLERLDRRIEQRFAAIEERLKARNLPQTILARHQEMLAHYRQGLTRLLLELQAVETAPDATERRQHLAQARAHLKARQNRRTPQYFDPRELPTRSLKPNPANRPKLEPQAFLDAGLDDRPRLRLAALGEFTFDQLPGADNPAYLAASDEITLSPAIRDQASALNHDPVEIYHWVRNHIVWQPSWGALQDARLTLAARRGNAMDIASLTLALLRASGIPARYVHGTIAVSAERFRNWSGGFASTAAAVDYAASSGLPIATVTAGGQISTVQLEHVWVEAAIDYFPSRGAKNRAADSWVALDPSYKQYTYLAGLDVQSISGIDPEPLAQALLASAQHNDTESWFSGLDPAILEAAQNQAQRQLQDYIDSQLTAPTVGDIIGGQKVIVRTHPGLTSALPNPILLTGAHYDKLPRVLQQTITLAFAQDVQGNPIDPLTLPWAVLNNQKLTLSFRPASEADAQALEALLPEEELTEPSQLPASIPAYLIEVIPELKHNGELIKAGAPLRLGEELVFSFNPHIVGQGTLPQRYRVPAGSYLAVAVVAGNVSPVLLEELSDRLAQTQRLLENQDPAPIAALTREDLLGELFHAGILGYYAQYLALSQLTTLPQKAHRHLAAGLGSFGYEPQVDYFFGVPRALRPGGAVMNIPLITVTGTDTPDPDQYKNVNIQLGVLSSALEHAVPEQLFNTDPNNPIDGISAVKALAKANAQGQRIYHLTPENMTTTLPNVHHADAVMDEIRASLLVGKDVITHTDAVSVPGWSGAGYIIFDPETGDGAYKIGGGQNGGYIAGALLGASLAMLALSLLIGSGGAIAVFLAAAAAIAAVFAGIFHTLLQIVATDEGYQQCFLGGFVTGMSVLFLILPNFISGLNRLASAILTSIGLTTLITGELGLNGNIFNNCRRN